MDRKLGRICVILVGCFNLAGCSNFQVDFASMTRLKSASLGRERVVSGSLESVASSTQSTLNQMGFVVNTSRKGDTIRVSSKTSSGAAFSLVLTRIKTEAGEQTKVQMEWEGASDDNLGLQILAQLPENAAK